MSLDRERSAFSIYLLWKIWRDKAGADFGISSQFFDLNRTLSGPQRYLQVASYIKLSPLSGVRVYDDRTIEGVYEALAGYREAERRRDPQMLLWFAERIGPDQEGALQEIQRWKEQPRLTNSLERIIEQGRVDLLDGILHDYFVLPEGFSIEKDIPYTPFWVEEFPIYNLPLQDTSDEESDVIGLAWSCSRLWGHSHCRFLSFHL